MDRLTAMNVFCEVAARGSLTDTAGALDMSRAMVSRYVESLERWLGVRLLHRTTRRVSLTPAGEEAFARCRQMVDSARELQGIAEVRRGAPTGKLRITTSPSFAQAVIARLVAQFVRLHPRTQIELVALDRAVNLVEERIDLAIRIGNRREENLVAKSLGTCHSVLCASPGYLAAHGTPATLEALAEHRCVTHAYVSRKEFRLHQGDTIVRVPVSGPVQCNEASIAREATLAGAGIAMLPLYLVAPDLAAARLVRVLAAHEPERLGIHALYLSRRNPPLVLRAMLGFLAEHLGATPQ